jgi:hypothetical protein
MASALIGCGDGRRVRNHGRTGAAAAKIGAAAYFATKLPALREMVRPIYVRLGVLPEIATGMQSAADLSEE